MNKIKKLAALLALAFLLLQAVVPVVYADNQAGANGISTGDVPSANTSRQDMGAAFDSLMNYYLNYSLQSGQEWMQRTQLSGSVFSGNNQQFSLSTIQPLWTPGDLSKMWFWQGSYNMGVSGGNTSSTLNAGVGYRSMFANNSGMAGINLFYDWQVAPRNHQRVSVGGEIYKNSLEAHFNFYQGVSDAVNLGTDPNNSQNNLYEQAANGFDATFGTNFSFWNAPWLKLSATGYKYFAQNGGTINGQNGGYGGMTLDLGWQVTPQLMVSVGTDVVNNSQYAKFSYNLLAPPAPATFGGDATINANASQDLSYKMYNQVVRNNQIVVEQYSKAKPVGAVAVMVKVVRPDGTPVQHGGVDIHSLDAPVGAVAVQNATMDSAGQTTVYVPAGTNTFTVRGTNVVGTLQVASGQSNEIVLVADISGTGDVTIKVKDKAGAPVVGHIIKMTDKNRVNYEATTDNDGKALFSVTAGEYDVEDVVTGETSKISVVTGETACITIYNSDMAELNVTLQQKDGKAAAGVRLSAFDNDSMKLRAKATTDANGKAVLELLEDSYTIRQANSDITTTVDVKAKEIKNITICPDKAAIADITLQKGDASIWSGQTLLALQNGNVVASACTDSSGVAHFELTAGEYTFQTSSGLQTASQKLTANKATSLIMKAGVTTVSFTDTANEPDKAAGIDISAFTESGTVVATQTTDNTGKAQFALAAGNYKFAISGDNVYSNVVPVSSSDTAVTLAAKAAIDITVANVDKTVAAGRWVNLYRDGVYSGAYQSNANGVVQTTLLKGHKYHAVLASSNLSADFVLTGSSKNTATISGSTVCITLLDAKGAKLANTKIVASLNGNDLAWETSNAAGVATFLLAAGNYVFRADGLNAKSGTITLTGNDNKECTIADKPAAVAVMVKLLHADGAPWPEKWLSAVFNGTKVTEIYTDANGAAQFSLEPGNYSFTNNMGISKAVTVAAGMDAVTLQGADVLVTVQNADGSLVNNAGVQLLDNTGKYIAQDTTKNGKTGFSVPAGQYRALLVDTSLTAEGIGAVTGKEITAVISLPAVMSTVEVIANKADDSAWANTWVSAIKDGKTAAQVKSNASGKAVFQLFAGNYIFNTVNNVKSKTYVMDGKSASQIQIISGDVEVSVLNAAGTVGATAKIVAVDTATNKEVAWVDQLNGKAYFGLADGNYRFNIEGTKVQSDVVAVVAGKIKTTSIDASSLATKKDFTISLTDANGVALANASGSYANFKVDNVTWPNENVVVANDTVTFKQVANAAHNFYIEYQQDGISDRVASVTVAAKATDTNIKAAFNNVRTLQVQAWDSEKNVAIKDTYKVQVDGRKVADNADKQTGIATLTGMIDGAHSFNVTTLPTGFESYTAPVNNVLSATNSTINILFVHSKQSVTLTALQSDNSTAMTMTNGSITKVTVDGANWPDFSLKSGKIVVTGLTTGSHAISASYQQNGKTDATESDVVMIPNGVDNGNIQFKNVRTITLQALEAAHLSALINSPATIMIDGKISGTTGVSDAEVRVVDVVDGSHVLTVPVLPDGYSTFIPPLNLETTATNFNLQVQFVMATSEYSIAVVDEDGQSLGESGGQLATGVIERITLDGNAVGEAVVNGANIKLNNVSPGSHEVKVLYRQNSSSGLSVWGSITMAKGDVSGTIKLPGVRRITVANYDTVRNKGLTDAEATVVMDSVNVQKTFHGKQGEVAFCGVIDGKHEFKLDSLPVGYVSYSGPKILVTGTGQSTVRLDLVPLLQDIVLTITGKDGSADLGTYGKIDKLLVDGVLWTAADIANGKVVVHAVPLGKHVYSVLYTLAKDNRLTITTNGTATLESGITAGTMKLATVRTTTITLYDDAKKALPNVSINLKGYGSVTSDASGCCTFKGIITDQEYVITVDNAGYKCSQEAIYIGSSSKNNKLTLVKT